MASGIAPISFSAISYHISHFNSACPCWAHPHTFTTAYSPSVLYSCSSFPHCLLQPHHFTCCLPYILICPLFLLVCSYLIPFSASPLNTTPPHFTVSCAIFLSHCPLPLWSLSFFLLFAMDLQHLSLLSSAFPSPNCSVFHHVLLLQFTAYSGQPHLLPVSSPPPPPLLPAAMFALYTHDFCLLFHLLLAITPQMTRTFLRSPHQAITYHHLPSCLFLLLHFVSTCLELACLQKALTTSPFHVC